ncbi:hypothetical protein [Paenibacillus sp. 32O-W]|uniref:hypothetical protein n=1 Tax=Paenibacillus sp. 32O-W TaxID=1695218 RepID=UPI0011A059CD|nr:hypothetical protein [Paenibacillus sp. 32O-W]
MSLICLSIQPVFAQNEKTPDDLQIQKNYLAEYGVTDDEFIKLEHHKDTLISLIKKKNLNKEQATNLKNSMLNLESGNIITLPVKDGLVYDNGHAFPVPHRSIPAEQNKNGNETLDTFTHNQLEPQLLDNEKLSSPLHGSLSSDAESHTINVLPPTSCGSGEGYHYIVSSGYGYRQASGDVTLPWGYAVTKYVNSNGIEVQNDIPYIFFGIYVNGGGGADAGIWYRGYDAKDAYGNVIAPAGWYTFVNGFRAYDGDNAWQNGYQKIPTGVPLQLVVTELNNAIEVTVYNETNWSVAAHNVFSRAAANGFNQNGTNTRWNSEISLAQHCTSPGLPYRQNGAYMLGSIWDNIYLYTTSGYGLWDSRKTTSNGWEPGFRTNVTSEYIHNPYYKYQASIDYRY